MITRTQKRYLLMACAILLAAAGVSTFSLARRAQQPERPPKREHLPKEYRSEVKGLEVESMTEDRERPGGPMLVVVIRNKTPRAVTAYSVNLGNFYQARDGGLKTDEPETVIEPHGTNTIEIAFSNIHSDAPLIITEAFYDDGTEEGREELRQWRREARERAKEKRDAKKGEPK